MNTDYNLYKIFLYLYEERSISKTANRLYVSQPAISYSLKELESQLGYTLFYRNSKGIEPTLEANELYSYISTAFDILEDAEEHLKNINELNTGCIRIGTPSHIGVSYLSEYISTFRKTYPGIKFEIISKSSADMIEMLETRKIDIIIDTLPINSKKDVTKVTLSKLYNCFAYNKNIMKDIDIKELDDLKNYPLILLNQSSSIRLKLDEYLESKNIKLLPIIESSTTEVMLEMVRKGLGIGYFVKKVVDNQNDKDDFEIITFENTLPAADVCCVYIDDFLSSATKKFIELITNDIVGK